MNPMLRSGRRRAPPRREGLVLEEVMMAARERQGLQTLRRIKFAIVERYGGISIVPVDEAKLAAA